MRINIRKAKTSEASVLTDIALNSKAYWGYAPEILESFRAELEVTGEKLSDPAFAYFAAIASERPVGFYALERLSAKKAELEALFVLPDWIGKGVGRKLIDHAMAHAVSLGFVEVVIQSDPNAERFYLAAGAKLIGEKESASIPGRMLPLFRMRLSNQT